LQVEGSARAKKKSATMQGPRNSLADIGELADADDHDQSDSSTKRGARTKRVRKRKTFSDQQAKKAALRPEEVEIVLTSTTVEAHELGRERKIQAYVPTQGRHQNTKTGARVGYVPVNSNVTAKQRIREFPNNFLIEAVNGTLFCELCRCEVHNFWRKSVVSQHVNSNKHVKKLEAATEKAPEVSTIDRLFKEALNKLQVGRTLDQSVHLKRMEALRAILKLGAGISSLCSPNGNDLKDLLERQLKVRLLDDRGLRDYVPLLRDVEKELVATELRNSSGRIGVIFDGTTRVCEVEAIVFRFCPKQSLQVQQRLVALPFLSHSPTAKELVKVAVNEIEKLCSRDDVLFFHSDRAEVNVCASRTLEVLFSRSLAIFCLSHTLDSVGGKIEAGLSAETRGFIAKWCKVLWRPSFSHRFKECFGRFPRSYSATRWWSRLEVIREIFEVRDDMCAFLGALQGAGECEKSAGKLMNFWRSKPLVNASARALGAVSSVEMELALVVDSCGPFHRSTYFLEGRFFFLL
jgi:hypothetical protein